MPALVDIRRRIRSVKNTQQITKAMKMVSAAKLRRAQDAMFAARPYARKMLEVLCTAWPRAPKRDAHPLLEERERRPHPARGRHRGQGAVRRLQRQHHPHGRALPGASAPERSSVELGLSGARAATSSGAASYRVRSEHVGVFQALRYATARRRSRKELIKAFTERRDGRGLPRLQRVQERDPAADRRRAAAAHRAADLLESAASRRFDYIYEPEPGEDLRRASCRKHVEVQVWRALLESAAAEHGARMAAMDAATNNAGDMIDRLTLYMNKVRQAAITKEIIEVVSGAGPQAPRASENSHGSWPQQNIGRVVQVIGPVVDVEFDDSGARHLQRRAHPGRRVGAAGSPSTSSPRWSSTSARTACAASACCPPTAWCAA